jgi:hypothetical protein
MNMKCVEVCQQPEKPRLRWIRHDNGDWIVTREDALSTCAVYESLYGGSVRTSEPVLAKFASGRWMK